jgi:hypothetical protein
MTPDDLTQADEQAIAAFMRQLADADPHVSPSLPSPDVFARQAAWRRRWDAERRVCRPLDVLVPLQVAAGLVAAVMIVARVIEANF